MKNKINKVILYVAFYIIVCAISWLSIFKVYKEAQVDYCNYAIDKGFYLETEKVKCASDYLDYLNNIIKRK